VNPKVFQSHASDGMQTRLDERSLSKLKWRCRRGLLENDLFIEHFFRHHEETITTRQAAGLMALMDLPDNDLLDLLLRRTQPQGELDRDEVNEVLEQLRRSPARAGEAPAGWLHGSNDH
jgi:antitoxin CptB